MQAPLPPRRIRGEVCQQLRHPRRLGHDRLADLLPRHRVRRHAAVLQHLGVQQDRLQGVLDLMEDARGCRPHGRQPLRLHALSHVAPDQRHGDPGREAEDHQRQADVHQHQSLGG